MSQQDKLASDKTQEVQSEFEVIISGKSAFRHDTEEKARIRAKYQSSTVKPVVITPAKAQEDRIRGIRQKLRVAAYCRVSTPNEAQISSIEMQKKYFQKYVAQHEDWVLVGIFADEYASYPEQSAPHIRDRTWQLPLLIGCNVGSIALEASFFSHKLVIYASDQII